MDGSVAGVTLVTVGAVQTEGDGVFGMGGQLPQAQMETVRAAVKVVAAFVGGDMDSAAVQGEGGAANAVGTAANGGAKEGAAGGVFVRAVEAQHHIGKLSVPIRNEEAYQWLFDNAWKYGFALRYPAGKTGTTGIEYEPWHFRYVGREVSLDMKDTGLCLEEYLGAPAVTQQLINTVHGDKWLREEYYIVTEDQRQQILNGKKVG